MRTLVIAAVASLLLVGSANADLTCSSSMTLHTLVECIRKQMPQDGSNGYVAPTPSQRADWRIVVNQMLQGSCDFAIPVSLNGIVQVRTFTGVLNRHAVPDIEQGHPISARSDLIVQRRLATEAGDGARLMLANPLASHDELVPLLNCAFRRSQPQITKVGHF